MDADKIIEIIMCILAPSGVLAGVISTLVAHFKGKGKLQKCAGKVELLNEQIKDEELTTSPKEMKKHIIKVLDELIIEMEEKK